ncbi:MULTISPECIES: GDCCVxC domain-containing (seleno)protein [Sphingobium]|uniref:GDCCVxC domain-containing (seleno)protein n=1 Tax=Sphingobium TaxID=165695 RepID=UPI0009DC430F|nr:MULTISPECIES: GDCCVxC domain-containing (seleno)protein [Sphingobium]MDX3910623.1 GDCCVxC domain-containing (seleno)protein [Sphingobium sp.]
MSERAPLLESTITCPQCGTVKTETMPTNACQYFYDCTGCGALLRPMAGDCCVFCSYGTVACPPIQLSGPGASCCA